jgi:hypothetical protein
VGCRQYAWAGIKNKQAITHALNKHNDERNINEAHKRDAEAQLLLQVDRGESKILQPLEGRSGHVNTTLKDLMGRPKTLTRGGKLQPLSSHQPNNWVSRAKMDHHMPSSLSPFRLQDPTGGSFSRAILVAFSKSSIHLSGVILPWRRTRCFSVGPP